VHGLCVQLATSWNKKSSAARVFLGVGGSRTVDRPPRYQFHGSSQGLAVALHGAALSQKSLMSTSDVVALTNLLPLFKSLRRSTRPYDCNYDVAALQPEVEKSYGSHSRAGAAAYAVGLVHGHTSESRQQYSSQIGDFETRVIRHRFKPDQPNIGQLAGIRAI
jgi:hypothetical protein